MICDSVSFEGFLKTCVTIQFSKFGVIEKDGSVFKSKQMLDYLFFALSGHCHDLHQRTIYHPRYNGKLQRVSVGEGSIVFDKESQLWRTEKDFNYRGTCIYSMEDGSFCVYSDTTMMCYRFSLDDVFSGLHDGKNIFCNGLIRDFSDHDIETLGIQGIYSGVCEFDKSTRVGLIDIRDIPTVKMKCQSGETLLVPVSALSFEYRRELAMLYLMDWIFKTNKDCSTLTGKEASENFMLIVDSPKSTVKYRENIFLGERLELLAKDFGYTNFQRVYLVD